MSLLVSYFSCPSSTSVSISTCSVPPLGHQAGGLSLALSDWPWPGLHTARTEWSDHWETPASTKSIKSVFKEKRAELRHLRNPHFWSCLLGDLFKKKKKIKSFFTQVVRKLKCTVCVCMCVFKERPSWFGRGSGKIFSERGECCEQVSSSKGSGRLSERRRGEEKKKWGQALHV